MPRKNRTVRDRSDILTHTKDSPSLRTQVVLTSACAIEDTPASPSLQLLCADSAAEVVAQPCEDVPNNGLATDVEKEAGPSDQTTAATVEETHSGQGGDSSPAKAAQSDPAGAPAQVEQRQPASSIPTKFGAYDIVWEIRRDALSTTYAARSEGIEKLLALRIFNVKLTDSALVRSIQKAASKTGELTHHNHVTIYDHGVGDCGAPYVVTDWVEGESLAETFQATKRMDIARFLDIFNQVSDALIEAHSHRLVHGNLSPHKIMLATNDYELDNVKLIDFGMPPDPVQCAYYLSPEQNLDRSKLDERTDIYSLGCIMYEALVGSPPFVGHKISKAALNYLHELANQYSPDSPEHNALKLLDCIIIKCLQEKPAKRFRNVRELTTALRLVNECISGENTRKLPPTADKLLLFRFLDFFDKKIWMALFILFLISGLSQRFLVEYQLQKALDQAMLHAYDGGNASVGDWEQALRMAYQANSQGKLKAELHENVGGGYEQQAQKVKSDATRLALMKKAAAQYSKAYDYYQHSKWRRADAIALLEDMARVQMDVSSFPNPTFAAEHDEVVASARKLIAQNKFADAAKVCDDFLEKYPHNSSVSLLGARAYNEAGMRLPAPQAARSLARAYTHALDGGYLNYVYSNLSVSINQLGYAPTANTYLYLGSEALKAGDLDAAYGDLAISGYSQAQELLSSMRNLREIKRHLPLAKSPDEAIATLTRLVKLKEEVFGQHSQELWRPLVDLGDCYYAKGDAVHAIAAYERAFAVIPNDTYSYSDGHQTSSFERPHFYFYVDGQDRHAVMLAQLYMQTGQADKACKFLTEQIREHEPPDVAPILNEHGRQFDGQLDFSSPLFSELILAYKASHNQAKVDSIVLDATGAGRPDNKSWIEEKPAI
jgi:serine/threonine protein kinase